MTSEFEAELPEDYEDEEALEDVSPGVNDDNDDESGNEAPNDRSPRNRTPTVDVSTLQAEIEKLSTDLADYKGRLGNALRVHGEELKKKDKEIEEWVRSVEEWHSDDITRERQEAFQEGVRSVEERLLPMLQPTEKAEYLQDVRLNTPAVSQREVPQLRDTRSQPERSEAPVVDDLSPMVQRFTALGVPVDQIEQTSAETVVDSATKWLEENKATAEEQARAQATADERRSRDESGATKVSSGTGGAPAAPRLSRARDEARLQELYQLKRRLQGSGRAAQWSQVLTEIKEIEARLARANQRRQAS